MRVGRYLCNTVEGIRDRAGPQRWQHAVFACGCVGRRCKGAWYHEHSRSWVGSRRQWCLRRTGNPYEQPGTVGAKVYLQPTCTFVVGYERDFDFKRWRETKRLGYEQVFSQRSLIYQLKPSSFALKPILLYLQPVHLIHNSFAPDPQFSIKESSPDLITTPFT